MIIDLQRLSDKLAPERFTLCFDDEATWTTVFCRPGSSELFERVQIKQIWRRFARRGEYVGVGVECAISPGRAVVEGMSEFLPLPNLGGLSADSARHLQDDKQARRWEDELVEAAPRAAHQFANLVGPELLARTTEARDAVKRYEQLIGFRHDDLKTLVVTLNKRASAAQRREVDRIVKCDISWLPRIYYELAALTVVVCASEVKGSEHANWYVGIDPCTLVGRTLMFELQLLASRFAEETGWPVR